jgi:hypothetical protein
MAHPNIEALQRENAELRRRLDGFRKLLDEVFEPRMIDFIGPEARSRLIQSMAPAEIGPHLRELALRCQSLARDSTDSRAARELAETASELADRASGLEAIFTIPAATRCP